MTRSIFLYLGMFVLVGGGFEGIRRVGNTLIPPRHIAGQWRVTAAPSFSSCPMLQFDETGEKGLWVEQSGRYLILIFSDTHRTRLRSHFDGGALRGSGQSANPCAVGKAALVAGRLKNDRLEITLTRAGETPMPAASALVLVATRTADTERRSSPPF